MRGDFRFEVTCLLIRSYVYMILVDAVARLVVGSAVIHRCSEGHGRDDHVLAHVPTAELGPVDTAELSACLTFELAKLAQGDGLAVDRDGELDLAPVVR